MTKLALSQNPLTHVLRTAVLDVLGHVPAAQRAVARKLSEIDNR
jgi:hypothetical protein